MYLLDVNVVLAAHRDDHPHYDFVSPWFERLAAGDEPFTVPVPVWVSFVRIATNRRIFREPASLAEAFDFLDATVNQPHHLLLGPGPRHLALLRAQCDAADARGDLVSDAVLAAIAVEHGCTVITLDRDFARFPDVRHTLLQR